MPIATAHFSRKAQNARDAEASVQRVLTFYEMEVGYDGDEEALASKTFMDKMGAEAHASVILAMDFDQPLQSRGCGPSPTHPIAWPFLTMVLQIAVRPWACQMVSAGWRSDHSCFWPSRTDAPCRTPCDHTLVSDNQGNVYSLLKESAKTMITAILAMDLILHTRLNQVGLAPPYVKREYKPLGGRAHTS